MKLKDINSSNQQKHYWSIKLNVIEIIFSVADSHPDVKFID